MYFDSNKIASSSSKIRSNIGYINNLYVKSGYRGVGNGTRLLKDTEEVLRNVRYVNKFVLTAYEEPNSMLERFYQKNFYKKTEKKISSVYDNYDIVYDLVRYEKGNQS